VRGVIRTSSRIRFERYCRSAALSKAKSVIYLEDCVVWTDSDEDYSLALDSFPLVHKVAHLRGFFFQTRRRRLRLEI
jgi:hypothetical protein